MASLWRISNYVDLNGEGGLRASGRWHSKGKPVVYLAESPAGAMLEHIIHLMDWYEGGELPSTYRLLRISVLEEVPVTTLTINEPSDWTEQIERTRQMGNQWLESRETALAKVPSAILPFTWNYLLNPLHSDAKQVRVEAVIEGQFDNRLVPFGKL